MGGDYYDRDVATTTSTTGYSDVSANAVGKVNKLQQDLNPQRWKDINLQSNFESPIVFALDVTGSMGDWTKIIYDKMPMFYGQIMLQNYLKDPALSFCAVGDYTCDEAPLQVTEFGQGTNIDSLISKMYLEGGGGGSYFESYELAAYFYNTHVDLNNSVLPFFFVTGDECFYEKIPEKHITKILGKPINENFIIARDCWKLKNYNVFLIKKPYDEERREVVIKKQWIETLGEERVLYISNPKACVDVMLGAIAITSGVRTLESYEKDMMDRGQTKERIIEVSEALRKYAEKTITKKIEIINRSKNIYYNNDLQNNNSISNSVNEGKNVIQKIEN